MECYESESSFSDKSNDTDIDIGEESRPREESENGLEDIKSSFSEFGLKSYRFEPLVAHESSKASSSTSDSLDSCSSDRESQDDIERLTTLTWCKCSCCENMPSTKENLCCREIQKVVDEIEEEKRITSSSDIQCITLHPCFSSVCLDRHVLKAAYHAYRQDYGSNMPDSNERKRYTAYTAYTAYRKYVRWIWAFLGREIRVILPSCVVAAIRRTFPNEDGLYCGFQFPN